MGAVFECEVPARLRDINLAGHVDNVEAMRVLDEARQSPEVFVDPELPMSAGERIEFAVRAAVADIAVRLGIRNDADAVPENQLGAVYWWLGELQGRLVQALER